MESNHGVPRDLGKQKSPRKAHARHSYHRVPLRIRHRRPLDDLVRMCILSSFREHLQHILVGKLRDNFIEPAKRADNTTELLVYNGLLSCKVRELQQPVDRQGVVA